MRPDRQTIVIVLAVCFSAICVFAIFTWFYLPQIENSLTSLEPSCTVGFTGTAATMTIRAWSANQDCQQLVDGKASFLGAPAASGTLYTMDQAPQGNVVCEKDVQGRHIIVRDSGFLTLIGSAVCQQLQKFK